MKPGPRRARCEGAQGDSVQRRYHHGGRWALAGALALAAAQAWALGTATIASNPYGSVTVQGATLSGATLSGWQTDAVIQLGSVPGDGTSVARIDFDGLDLPAGTTLTVRAGAAGQGVLLYNVAGGPSTLDGTLRFYGVTGSTLRAQVQDPRGLVVSGTGRVTTSAALTVSTLGADWTVGETLVNQGLVKGDAQLRVQGGRITGGGRFVGNDIHVATFGNANNPVNGNFFLSNSLQFAPSTGTAVALSVSHYGAGPQVMNLAVDGDALFAMPSAWPAGYFAPANSLPALPGEVRPPGAGNPAHGASGLIVQATGNLKLAGGASGDLVLAGGVVLKAGGTLDLDGVAIVNGWTLAGQSFQGVNLEAPRITSSNGPIRIYTNNRNWGNFSTFPYAPVRTWQFLPQPDGSATYVPADAVVPHLNPYAALVDAAARGECWTCLVDMRPFDMRAPDDTRKDAARFLRQATFGANRDDIEALVREGYDAWLARQFAAPTVSHLGTVQADPYLILSNAYVTNQSIWRQFFTGQDQLRQRVGYALSQIYVVSLANGFVANSPCGAAGYLDTLNRHAFGNWRDLLRDVTLHPIMGEYLSMKESAKADPVLKTKPDENYAREVMQLFSVGLVLLEPDGTEKVDAAGQRIPSFTENTVRDFAKALSGWTFGGQDQSLSWRWLYPDIWDEDPVVAVQKGCAAWTRPMEPWLTRYLSADATREINGPAHDLSAKQLLVYPGAPHSTLPAGQSAAVDLDNLIENVFRHPNVGPFIGKLLIQRMVTSNPSAAYVARVAQAFADNGSGARGDMKAVIRAILLDPEARSLAARDGPAFGKLSEPVVRFVQLHRAFNAAKANGYYDLRGGLNAPTQLNQSPLFAPSVFNFYHPDFMPTGPLTRNGLVGPEFEIATSTAISGFSEFAKTDIIDGFEHGNPDAAARIVPDYARYVALAADPVALIAELDLVLAGGAMSGEAKALIAASIGTITVARDEEAQGRERLRTALWLILNSPDYLVER